MAPDRISGAIYRFISLSLFSERGDVFPLSRAPRGLKRIVGIVSISQNNLIDDIAALNAA
jgi:hypothetical protein